MIGCRCVLADSNLIWFDLMSKVKGCAKCGGLVKPGYDCELCDAGFCGDCVYIKKVTKAKKIRKDLNLVFSGWQSTQGGL